MPQPFRRQGNIAVAGLGERPEHASKLGMIVALSAGLESQLGYLLALLSGGSASITMTLFQAVSSTDAQKAMLIAAAQRQLAPPEFEEFEALMKEWRPRYGERSKLVHNLWGTSEAYPDDAIWCPASAVADYHAGQMGSFDMAAGLDGLGTALAFPTKCQVYTVQDLQDVIDRLWAYIDSVNSFSQKLASRHPVLAARARSSPDNAPHQA